MTNIATTPGFSAIVDGRVLRITLTNPRRKNAINYDTMVGLGDIVRAASANKSLRVIVLTGEGGDFCTGADLAAGPADAARGITPEMTMDGANAMVRAIVDSPLPVVTRVKGAAAGIGAAIALAADLSYFSADAYLLLAFINIGLMPDGGAAAMVAAAAGRPLAAEMALLGERLPATRAKEYGLITDVLSDADLDARVEAVVAKLAGGPRRATELTKRALNEAALASLDGVLAAEKVGQSELLEAADFAEGAAAMLQKRKPVFED
ncbi:enoyl-CoA hydratase [Nocardia uniformis]|uniref:Enoyl-CoA hydratase n=1 Tax=Nocardia uniformis TaxID=53432 RepID=A0A849BZ45_9NOCA|nr:enoyl-CoA hydratase-related protein [Nocardia uniformis]NNH71782.1 enoyl-CoA hydratase [Nocardia uniformis]